MITDFTRYAILTGESFVILLYKEIDSSLIGYLEANVITATKQVIVTDYNDNRFY